MKVLTQKGFVGCVLVTCGALVSCGGAVDEGAVAQSSKIMAREGSANHLYAAAEPEGQIVDGMSILSQDHPFYSSLDSEFKNLGQVVQVGSVFWSGVSHQKLNHRKAANFCADRAADLPTEAQCRSLAAAMGVGSASEWAGYRFWTSERKENGAVFFDGTTGELSTVGRDTPLNVRCVTTE